MIPVFQDRLNFNDGDCFRACTASILEVDVTSLPDFTERGEESFQKKIQEFNNNSGFLMFTLPVVDWKYFKNVHCIAIGSSPRNIENKHAVVYRNNEMVHDPHPSGSGVVGNPVSYTFFIKK